MPKRSFHDMSVSSDSQHKGCDTSKTVITIDHTLHSDYADHQRLLKNKSLDDIDCDIKFIVDNIQISAHRPVIEILKTKRTLVKNAIERDKQLARQDNAEEATIFQMSGTTVEAFKKLLAYIYTGKVDCQLNVAIDLATTAHKLKFHPLVASLAQHLYVHRKHCLNISTVDDLYHIAKSATNDELLKSCCRFMDDKPYDCANGSLKRDIQDTDTNNVLIYTLDKTRVANYIHFYLPENTEICFTLSVSSDRKNWQPVLNNREIWTKFWNWVYFEERRIKYIRFVVTEQTKEKPFNARSLKDEHVVVKRANVPLEFDKETRLLIPKHDIIKYPIKDTKFVFDHENHCFTYCTSHASAKDKEKQYYYHCIGDGNNLEFYLSQTCLIDSFRFRLWDKDDRCYSFRVEVKKEDEDDESGWSVIQDNNCSEFRNKSSWVTIPLRRRQAVRWIRVTGLKGPPNDSEFAIIDFECPAVNKTKH